MPIVSIPKQVLSTPGQIEPAERELYYRLIANEYRGLGEIVEIGTLIGASSVAFAQGLLDNPHVANKRKRIHSFDTFRFVASEVFDAKFFSQHGITLGDDGDFFDAYRRNIADYSDLIEATKGDASKGVWCGGPIEVLFVDGDKTAEFQDAIIRIFYPHLIPGISLIVEQDFLFPPAHAIPVKSQVFGRYMQPIKAAATTMVSRYVSAIPAKEVERPISRLSVKERAAVLEQMATGIPVPELSQLLKLQRATLLAENGDVGKAKEAVIEILAHPTTDYIAMHAKMLRDRYLT
jgi:hypothetical protein